MTINPEDFSRPDMWTTYSDIEGPARALIQESDGQRRDGPLLDEYVDRVTPLGLHGAWAACALTGCALDDLAQLIAPNRHVRTMIAMLGGIPPWHNTPEQRSIQAILSNNAAGISSQTMEWMRAFDERGEADVLIRGLGERLIFATSTTVLLGRFDRTEYAANFGERFFSDVR